MYSAVSATFVLFFFLTVEPNLEGNDIFKTKIECIIDEPFKNIVKFVFANSFLYGSYLSSGTFLKRFPLLIIRRENSVFPYLRSLPVNFSKEGQRAKEGKVLYCMHTAAVENFRERNRK